MVKSKRKSQLENARQLKIKKAKHDAALVRATAAAIVQDERDILAVVKETVPRWTINISPAWTLSPHTRCSPHLRPLSALLRPRMRTRSPIAGMISLERNTAQQRG